MGKEDCEWYIYIKKNNVHNLQMAKNELLHGTWGLMPFLNFSLVVSAQ